jgi:hypothetical protein
MGKRQAVLTVVIAFLAFHVGLFFPIQQGYAQLSTSQKPGEVKQTPPVMQTVGEGNQYYLGQANELLIRVNVWGRVLRPGQYYVPATTDLITLISAAGGPEARSRLTDVKVVRSGLAGAENQVFEVNIKKFLKTGDKRLIPALKPEDTVIVGGSAWQLFTDIMQVMGSVALIANVYYLFVIRKN